MANVIRLVNGGSIQVRTGVIQGIGPQGPTGVSGPQGQQGEQGPIGEGGPMGQILQLQAKTNVSVNNTVAANTDQVIAFGSVSYDDLSCFSSSSNTTLTAAGDYLLSCWLRFDQNAPKPVAVWFAIGGSIIAATTELTDASTPTYVDLSFPYRAAGGEVLNVLVRSGAATACSLGSLVVTRVGSGPPGPAGPVGPQGNIGPAGAKGDKGDPGSASSGFATYADLLP
jgi:hypothetical protein